MPELPHGRYHRLQKDYDLNGYEANILVEHKDIADFFEAAAKLCEKPKLISNWIQRDVLGYIKEHKVKFEDLNISPETFAELITVIDRGIINTKVAAQEVFPEMVKTGKYPSIIIEEKNLKQIESNSELEKTVLKIIKENPDTVQKYLSGKDKLFMFFVGQAMKETKGKGNPKVLQELFKKHLK